MATRQATDGQSHLRAIRHATGKTLGEVAASAGIARTHLARLERGEHSPSVDSFAGIASALGLHSLARQLEPFLTHREDDR